jgi:hypothetical protein
MMDDRPFTKITDAAGSAVLGITFDNPIPWPVFDGGGADSRTPVGDLIADALLGEADKRDQALTDLRDRADLIRSDWIEWTRRDAEAASAEVIGVINSAFVLNEAQKDRLRHAVHLLSEVKRFQARAADLLAEMGQEKSS